MTILHCRFKEGSLARGAYALGAYALAAGALLLYFLLCQADANPAVYAHGANSLAELLALAVTPEPLPMALLGTALLSAHMALRRRHSATDR
jgi:hypothetical protein